MAVLKLSQITASGAGFTTGDFIVAVQGGTTDVLFSFAQLFTPPIVLTATATGAYSVLTLTGQTGILAASQPVINATQTWNNSGVTFIGYRLGVNDVAAAVNSYILAVVGSSNNVVEFGVTKVSGGYQSQSPLGSVTAGGLPGMSFLAASTTGFGADGSNLAAWLAGNIELDIIANQLRIRRDSSFAWASATNNNAAGDTILTRGGAAATVQQGAADAAAPVAQTLKVQSVVAGTASHVGADWTLIGSKGTGTTAGAGGKIIFQTAPVASGTGATAQNPAATALTLTAPPLGGNGGTVTQQPSVLVGNSALATTDTDGFLYIPTCAGAPTGTPTAVTGLIPMIYDTTNHQFWFYDGAAWLQPKTPAGAAVVTWQ